MKLSFVILAACLSWSVAQNVVDVENVDTNMELCKRRCQYNGRCPSTTSIIITVQRFSNDCRDCITEECGTPGRVNRTMVAECMFNTRLECEDECNVSNGVRQFHANCMNCITSCTESPDSNTARMATRPPIRVRPYTSRRFGIFGSRRFSFSSRTFAPIRMSRTNVTICGCHTFMRCPTSSSVVKAMLGFSQECRACLRNECDQVMQSNRTAYFRCVFEARSSCNECPNRTSGEDRLMSQCGTCERRCRIFRVPVFTLGRHVPINLCSRDCVAPFYCPSSDSIIATIGRSSETCQACIREECGTPTNETKDTVSQCMYTARPDCDGCGFNSSSQMQRDRCSRCRMDCENADTDDSDETDEDDEDDNDDDEDDDDDEEEGDNGNERIPVETFEGSN